MVLGTCCKSSLKRLFLWWFEAELGGLGALPNASSLCPSQTPFWRSRASSPYPERPLPSPRINTACVCAADVLLGHEHDFRVKHLSEALNDKHGPLAGEYR